MITAAATAAVFAATAHAQTPDASVLRGETVRCDATVSEGHPADYIWTVTDPLGNPVLIEPGSGGILDLVMNQSGTWQVGVEAVYAHTVDKDPWTSTFTGTVEVTSVIAALTTIPADDPLPIPITASFQLDGTASRFGADATVEATWTYSDGGTWGTLSECAGGQVTDPSELMCDATGAFLGEGSWTLRLELEDTSNGETDSAEVEVVVTDFQVDFTWAPDHPDPGETVALYPVLPAGYTTADIDHVDWDFGDGILETDSCGFPLYCSAWSHTFQYDGIYVIRETVYTIGGESDTVEHTITVGTPPAPPVASFSVSLDSATAPAVATFTFTGSCDGTCAYTWTFGDGSSVSGTHTGGPPAIDHTYSEAGDHTARLELSNPSGSDNTEVVVSIGQAPPPGAIFSDGFENGLTSWSAVVPGA